MLAACSGGDGAAPPADAPPDSPAAPAAPGIVTSTTTLQTSEGGGHMPFTVSLASAPRADPVVVIVTSLDTTEGELTTSETSSTGSSSETLIFTAADWGTPRTLYVLPRDDAESDGDITYTIRIAVDRSLTADSTYAEVPDISLSVTNADDDIAGFTLSKTAASTTETGGTDSFTVALNTAPSASVTIPVQSLDVTEGKLVVGSATSCALAQASVSLAFSTSSWSTPQTVKVCGQNDPVDDGNVTYTVQVGPPTGAAEYAPLVAKTVSVTNLDDDTAGITVTAGATPLVTTENGASASFTVRLNTMPENDVVVPVTSGDVAEGLLSSGTQNLRETVNLTFTSASWSTPQTVTVTGQDEVSTQVFGDNVTYDVTVGPPTGDPVYAGSVAAQKVSVVNMDNDAPVVLLSPPAGSTLTVSESGTTATFSVRINKQPANGANVVIPVSSSDITEVLVQGGNSPSGAQQSIHLTFTQVDWQTPQTVTVVGQMDGTVDGPQTSVITVGKPTSADPGFDALAATSLSVITTDTDSPGFTVSPTTLSHTEGGPVVSFTVVLTKRPTVDVTVPIVSSNAAEGLVSTSAAGPFAASTTLTFSNADALTPQTVYVKGPTDDIEDGNKTYTIRVGPSSSSDSRWNLAARTVSATNADVDKAGLVVTPMIGLVTTEAGGTATFSVMLASKPTQTVTIPVAVPSSDTGEVRVSWGGGAPATATMLYFTGDNWNVAQQVTLTGQDDAILDGNRSFNVSVGPTTSADPKYNGLSITVSGQNVDNDVGHSEGTSQSPLQLASLPYAGQVGPGSTTTPGYSYYAISRPAGSVAITLTDVSAGVTLTLDDDAKPANGNLCTIVIAAFSSGTCTATLSSAGTLYIRVSTTAPAGAGYTIRDTPVQMTWTSVDVPKAISQTSDTYSILTVSGAPTSIFKVTVKLNVTHTWDADVDVYLIAPDGTIVELSTDNGGSGDNYTNTVFDDAAATSITLGSAPFTGTYRPEGLLSALNGRDANGTWQLRVFDDAYDSYTGTLTGWSITIQ